ncbi:MAG: chemotaxis protein CheW [Vulcanimicrobiaceae bacterium]
MSAQELLVRRAQRLSQSAALFREPVRTVELLCFHIAGEPYTLETRFTFSVMQRAKPAAMPGLPSHFLGILGVQGEIVPVIDLAAIWRKAGGRPETPSAVILGIDAPEFAIVVDALDELVRVPELELASAPALQDHNDLVTRLIRGMSLLDGAAMLEDRRFSVQLPDEQRGVS